MVRVILSALCLFAVVGFVAAEEKKADAAKTTTGKFKSLKDGVLTISVGKGDAAKDMTFKVGDDLKATVLSGAEKKELGVKDAFKELKEGTPVAVKVEGEKVTGITVGVAPKPNK